MNRKLVAATLLVSLLGPLALALAVSAARHSRLAGPAEGKEFPAEMPLVFLEEDERESDRLEIEVLRPTVSTELYVIVHTWPAAVASAADAFPACPIYYRLLHLLT
jgi:hypothetical protein